MNFYCTPPVPLLYPSCILPVPLLYPYCTLPVHTLHRPHIDPKWTFKKVMETQKELKDTEGFDWLESTELAIDKRKFLLNRLYQKQQKLVQL